MKARHLLPALLVLAAAASANPWPNGYPTAPAPAEGGMRGHHGFGRGGSVIIIEQPPVIVEREVVREVPVAPPAPPPPAPAPRKAHVLGRTYASLPPGCMKMIERGAVYFRCSGLWYREVRDEGGGRYRAVAGP
jgi:hypothetical protein